MLEKIKSFHKAYLKDWGLELLRYETDQKIAESEKIAGSKEEPCRYHFTFKWGKKIIPITFSSDKNIVVTFQEIFIEYDVPLL